MYYTAPRAPPFSAKAKNALGEPTSADDVSDNALDAAAFLAVFLSSARLKARSFGRFPNSAAPLTAKKHVPAPSNGIIKGTFRGGAAAAAPIPATILFSGTTRISYPARIPELSIYAPFTA